MSQRPIRCRSLVVLVAFVASLFALAGSPPAGAGELGSATLQIAGTRLAVSPLGQTVPFDTATLVQTHLEGYDAGLGALPSSLKVLGDFSGPGIEGVVPLSTVPNEPFRIPRLRVKGAYSLANIRLVQDGELLAYAEPRSVSVNATQILVTKVSARPLTEDEMRGYGIVLDNSNYQTLNLTFGFAVEGKTFDYNMPVVYRLFDTDGEWGVPINEIRLPEMSGGTVDSPRFKPPSLTPFKLELGPAVLEAEVPEGGCDYKHSECRVEEAPAPPMVGVILFPTELTMLHQFFSVVLMVQNGAPEGDPLTIRDLTAKATLPSGLRPARTEPPTPLGVPVPLRVPGPDGQVGTADDVTFLIAQATGEAEYLVEGLREGTHLVQFDMAGILEGLPGGPQPITGKATGAVVVRDPTLSVTISHPDIVRANEEYPLYLTVTNLGKAPVNALDVGFKTAGLAGTEVVGDASREVGNLLPGDSRVVEFTMKALLTGKVVSSSARAGGSTRPGFELSVGVANGIPLSPESLVLPGTSKYVPTGLYKEALGLIGLAWSLAKAPPSVAGDQPQTTEAEMNDRVYRLSQMGRQIGLGEEVFEASAALAAEWAGARDGGWEWDGLRRKTTRGREFARVLGELLAERVDGSAGVADDNEALEIAERFAATNHYLSPIVFAAYGSDLEIEVKSRTSGKAIRGRGAGATRDLPFAELYPLAPAAELGLIARAEEGGYELRLRRTAGGGSVTFELILPSASPEDELARYEWRNVSLPQGAVAKAIFDAETGTPLLSIDDDGDGDEDRQAIPAISELDRRPFEVISARLDFDVDLGAHVIEVLFSADIDLETLVPRDPDHFRIDGRVSNGGVTPAEESISLSALGGPDIDNPLEGLFNPRIVRVVFNNPIPPATATTMTVAGLRDSAGREFGEQETTVLPGPGALPGTAVLGQVIDPYGQPLPYAEVSLFEKDRSGVAGITDECVRHRSARTRADGEGRFRFDYVRQTSCGNDFELEAIDPAAPHWGRAHGQVLFVNGEQSLNVVMLGRAWVKGRVTYSDGTVPPGLKVLAYNPVFDEGRQAKVMPNGDYQMAEVVVGTVTLYAYDELGNRVFQTIEVPAAGAEVVRNLVMLKQSTTSSAATVRGKVTRLADGEPSPGALVLLTVDGRELGVRAADAEGNFDFGSVPTGGAELVAYHPQTGQVGAKLALSLAADQNAYAELHLRDDRGRFVGYVKRIASDGTVTPLVDAVVFVRGMPFNTRTDANGYYELPEVLTGSWTVVAADVEANVTTELIGTVTAATDTRLDLVFRATVTTRGSIAGTVYDVDGQLVKNATIHLAGDEWSVTWHYEATTDNQGRFRIDNLDPGIYGVHAIKGSDGAIGYANVRFPGDLADIGIHFVRSRLTGRTYTRDEDGNTFGVISLIRYRPVEVHSQWGLVVVASDYKTLVTNPDGTFAIDALPGPIDIIVHNSFHGSVRRGYVLSAVPTVADVEFERSGAIHGVVVDHDGVTPVPGVELRLTGATFSNYTLHSDESGKFDFELLPPGGYGIEAIDQRNGILRQGFASVLVHRFGDEVDVKLELPKQGTVYGQVFDADWEPVANVAVTLHGDRYPRQVITRNTDAEGRFTFTNVYAGSIALVARAPELGGLGGKARIDVGMEGEEVPVEIQLEGVGELTGRILNPDGGGVPVPNAEVRLESIGIGPLAGYTFTINSDFEGRYRFDRLPLAAYRIYAFDPGTGRRGVSEWKLIEHHGDVAELDLELESRGTVAGTLYNDPSLQTIPGATIKLEHSGMVRFQVFSSTDIDGHFDFGGIPEGEFKLDTVVGGRRAYNQGAIEVEDQLVTRDLHLEALAQISGAVRRPRTAAGPSTALAEGVNVLVYTVDHRVVAAATENPFVLQGLLPGFYVVEAREIDGPRRVIQEVNLTPGAAPTLDLELRGRLAGKVRVFEANGQPIAGDVYVTIDNTYKLINQAANGDLYYPFEFQTFSGTIGSGNTYDVDGVFQGRLNVRVSDPLHPTRKGSGSAVTGYEGDTTTVDVTLIATGKVCGTVFLSDGTTPAAAARISLKPETEGYRLADADAAGQFCFDILPRVNFRLDAQQAGGLGTYALNGSWATGEYDKSYEIVLDDTNPQVVSVTPPHNATGVPLATPLVIEFTEAVCRTCGGIQLFNSSGWPIAIPATWSSDGKKVTLTPTLESNTGYRLLIRRPLADLAGREIAYDVTSLFQTADVLPPTVIEVRPAAGQDQVPVATTIKVTFSEPIDPNLQPGNFQLLRLDQGNFSETLIPLVIAENRRVSLTVTPDLLTDQYYELRVSGIKDTSGNVMAGTFTSRFYTVDTTPPQFTWTTPAAGQLFKAGDRIALEGTATDRRGVASVEYQVGGRSRLLTAQPYKAELPAPRVETTGPVTVTAIVKDLFGNTATFTREIVVQPREPGAIPALGASCPGDGDLVARGSALDVAFEVTDDHGVESYWLKVNGQTVKTVLTEAAAVSASIAWTPPAQTALGTTFSLEIGASDFAGQVASRTFTVTVPTAEPHKANRPFPTSGDVLLGRESYTLPGSVTLSSLTLLDGATLSAPAGATLTVTGSLVGQCRSKTKLERLTVGGLRIKNGGRLEAATAGQPLVLRSAGTLRVDAGGAIDTGATGYPGGQVPAGVTPAPTWGGGSHGGRGASATSGTSPVFDSVYRPVLGGGGASGPEVGGGVLDIEAAELQLDGSLLARPKDTILPGIGGTAAAGGTVALRVNRLTGSGTIDASGGDVKVTNVCGYNGAVFGGGGGGRVSLFAEELDGFDPATQVKVRGGRATDWLLRRCNDAAPGTLYVKTPESTYGTLRIDAGLFINGDALTPIPTELPTLGSGEPSSLTATGANARLERTGGFPEAWLGVWVDLLDGSGTVLGTYEVVGRDGSGRLELAGAGAVTGVASYRGRYRFDELVLRRGAGLVNVDPVDTTSTTLGGSVELSAPVTAETAVVASGAVVKPAAGQRGVTFKVSGKLTIEAGATIDVVSKGYPGGQVPAGVTPLPTWGGGSHGGRGATNLTSGGTSPTFDSVYRPILGGGGASGGGEAGSGVIEIEADELQLDGTLLARAKDTVLVGIGGTAPAGGTVAIQVNRLSGSGTIDASGGDAQVTNVCGYNGAVFGGGGGGRVSLHAAELDGFDPAAQVKVRGGRATDWQLHRCNDAAPGTLFVKTADSTYGSLRIDAGLFVNGEAMTPIPTELPTLGAGAPGSLTAVGPNARLERSGGFPEAWRGVWVDLLDGGGAVLGTYEAIGRDAGGQLELSGAADAVGAASYRGRYRFDEMVVLRGAGLTNADPLDTGTTTLTGNVELSAPQTAQNLVVKSGAVIKPASGIKGVSFKVSGKLTIEAGATIDVVSKGYPGGQVPAGVTPAPTWGGGSHGGRGATNLASGGTSPTFDSVYRPILGGGGGSGGGEAGSGVIEIEADELQLDGTLLAKAKDTILVGIGGTAPAGGTVAIQVNKLSGSGTIDASGGDAQVTNVCGYNGAVFGGGGGGRVSLHAAELDGFDPAAQVKVRGGRATDWQLHRCNDAAPGTLFVKTAESTYGALRIDAGLFTNGDALTPIATELPALGSGTPGSLTAIGANARLERTGGFPEAWRGVWVDLLDGGGAVLGTYEAIGRDAVGQLELAGAADAVGAASYRGRYRFDEMVLLHGAGLANTDPLDTGTTTLTGTVELSAPQTALNLVIKNGAVVKPAAGLKGVSFKVSGKLTIEAGAKIDVTGKGYGNGQTPPGVPAVHLGGGSHGGQGTAPQGTPGPVYDSVYRPTLAGGGPEVFGAFKNGGGVIDLEAGEIELQGELLAKSIEDDGGSTGGAGGTIAIRAGKLWGAGAINASGGDLFNSNCYYNGYPNDAGGGGRVSLIVPDLTGFDSATQVKVRGGRAAGGADNSVRCSDSAPGTLYVKTSSSVYGKLVIDAGVFVNGAALTPGPTELPTLGNGVLSAATAAGGDLWVTRSGGFAEQWLGAWIELNDSGGGLLGLFEAVERDGTSRLRLAGAGTATTAASYRGVYRFDEIQTLRGATYESGAPLELTTAYTVSGNRKLAELRVPNLTVAAGATLVSPTGSVRLVVPGTVTIESGAKIDVTGGGYAGTTTDGVAAGAPAGITGSVRAGGSHGGSGDSETGTPGAVYDSVYRPQLSGGGGNRATDATHGRGGGVIEIVAGTLALEGQLLARGDSHTADGYSAGAGGTVRIVASTLSGAGLIDAGGGSQTASGGTCVATSGGGGGGRVALEVANLSAFDVAAKARAYAGRTDCPGTITDRYGAAGTVYVKTTGSTYGTLHLDAGVSAAGYERVKPTTLPVLGGGSVSVLTAAGSDAWLAAATPFTASWTGTWVELRDAGGSLLGTYEVAAIDLAGRLRLAGAASAVAATQYRGRYRFDQIVTRNTTGLATEDLYGQPYYLSGAAYLPADFTTTDLTVAAGALVRPATGSKLALHVSGTLRVEAGGKIDVSSLSAAAVPAGVTASANGGGSHGGRGETVSGVSGDTFDSVYRPTLAGAGGNPYSLNAYDGRGGGVLEIDAANLVLDGQLVSRGGGFTRAGAGGAGAGGTIRVAAPQLSGSGTIDVSGGNLVTSDCSALSGGGGGGRVALEVPDLSGFAADTQVKAYTGITDCTSGTDRFAAAGTVYVFTTGSTYGKLRVDAGDNWNGVQRTALTTWLPPLGDGAITSLTAAGGDAWLERATAFGEVWLGAWVELRSSGGALLGIYRAAERDGSGRLRLVGAAGSVGSATTYKGVYKFDRVDVVRGAALEGGEPGAGGPTTLLEGTVTVASPFTAVNLRIKAGAVVKPQTGTTLAFRVTGTMTVEAGAKVDLTGIVNGGTPSGFQGPVNGGGGHGGGGDSLITETPGATFDSVYRPQLPGSMGWTNNPNNRAGGVIDIEANTLDLQGSLLAQGGSFTVDGSSTGAGGTVRVKAGTLSGSGLIDASGGVVTASGSTCHYFFGGGGGGRVALEVGSFAGFDPESQARAWAGYSDCQGTANDRFAAAGTLYLKTASSTYGTLVIDPGDNVNGANRVARATQLTNLGASVAITSFTVAGGDAWVQKASGFGEHWWGVWVVIRDAGGTVLGTYEAVERDSAGKLRLAGAGAMSGTAATAEGTYRFDLLKVKRGGGFDYSNTLSVTNAELYDRVPLAKLTATNLVVKNGATLYPWSWVPANFAVKLTVSGTMTVESGAKVDTSALVNTGTPSGYGFNAPVNAGGGHGGSGDALSGNTPGGPFDSVYRPQLAGSMGFTNNVNNRAGGVIEIEAGTLNLQGSLLAQGSSFAVDGASTGAGGTVRIKAATLAGSGLIDVSGGVVTATTSTCHSYFGGGGGGRVALDVGTLSSFDPESQARAWAGYTDCQGTANDRFAAAGTIYVKTSASTYGSLIVDPGDNVNGANRLARATELTSVPSVALTSFTVAGSDAWVQKTDGFGIHWWGVWVMLKDAGGNVLGTYEAIDRDSAGKLRLAGAGSVSGTPTAAEGSYRFDLLKLKRGGGIDHSNGATFTTVELYDQALLAKPLVAGSLTVKNGATVKPAGGATSLKVLASGAVTIESTGKLDVSAISTFATPSSFTTPSGAGGGHGGSGDTGTWTAGGSYDSVYRPQQAGAIGSNTHVLNRSGGVIEIEAASLSLQGQLLATGSTFTSDGYSTAAGGSVRIKTTGAVTGSGSIDVSGGSAVNTGSTCYDNFGGGGGGRVAIAASGFSGGFDPEAQIKAWSGVTDCQGTAGDRFAAAGTIYWKTSGATYGNLLIDAGESFNGAVRKARPTELTGLPSVALTSFTVAGGDAWINKSSGFGEQWWGAWVILKDSGSNVLGTYEAVERDSTGKLRLAGAGSVSGTPASVEGSYRFDLVKVKRGGGIDYSNSTTFTSVELYDRAVLGKPLVAGSVAVKSGASVQPWGAANYTVKMTVGGTLSVEAGAKLDVAAIANTSTPSGFNFTTPSSAGGGHGGSGDAGTGTAGGPFDSVYRPQQPGAMGVTNNVANRAGGVIDLEAGTLSLQGSLLAQGGSYTFDGASTAAGGTVRVKAGTLSGSGLIDVSGGVMTAAGSTCHWYFGGGGGGRVGLEVGSFSGFDPDSQARAWAGYTDCPGTADDRFAAAGTIYWKTSGSTYGNLLIDPGASFNGAVRTARATELTSVPNTALSSFTTAGSDAWIQKTDGFGVHWLGVWVVLMDSGNTVLGTYEAIDRDSAGKLRLAGAGSVVGTPAKAEGSYRFDLLRLKRGAGLDHSNAATFTSVEIYDRAILAKTLSAGTVTIKDGATVKPAGAGTSVKLAASGSVTIESGAKIDVSALAAFATPGGFTGPNGGGGGHGGMGDTGVYTAGGPYDSVYRPQQPGAMGSTTNTSVLNRGGGVIEIEAASLVLGGQLLATGSTFSADAVATAAGGSVWIKTSGSVSGAGIIDASGGNSVHSGSGCPTNLGGGGGGRVAVVADSFSGFDPDAQINAWAGVSDCPGTSGDRFAAAGTIYWKTAASTYGTLRVAGGDNWNGVTRTPRATVLPTLGNASPSALTAAGADAWLTKNGGGAFAENWLGVWIELKNGATVIGSYQAVERDASGKLRLAGASGAVGSTTNYRGYYRFDEVHQRQGSTVTGADTISAGTYNSTWTPGQDGAEGSGIESLTLPGSAAGEGNDDEEGGRTLAGRLFNDLDGDGALGSGEPPLVGVVVKALGDDGAELGSAISDRLGRYRLSHLPAGAITLEVEQGSLPGGLELPSFDADGVASPGRIVVTERQVRSVDFGYRQADLVLPQGAPAPACATCGPAPRPTPAPPADLVCDAAAPFDTVFLLDLSGGMEAPFGDAASRLEAAQLAIASLERRLAARGDGSRLALLTYRSRGAAAEVALLQGLSERTDAFEDRLFGLAAADLTAGDGSPAALALATAVRLLAASGLPGHQPQIVWLTGQDPDVDARLRPSPSGGVSLVGADGAFRRAAEVAASYCMDNPAACLDKARAGSCKDNPAACLDKAAARDCIDNPSACMDKALTGQAKADAMVVIEEAGAAVPGLRIDGVGLLGLPGWRGELLDYAAAFTGGSRTAAGDLPRLERGLEDLYASFVCAAP